MELEGSLSPPQYPILSSPILTYEKRWRDNINVKLKEYKVVAWIYLDKSRVYRWDFMIMATTVRVLYEEGNSSR